MKHINAQELIDTIDSIAKNNYRDGETVDRLAYQVGLLNSKVRELVNLVNQDSQIIAGLLLDLEQV
jgi:hypothetical protein